MKLITKIALGIFAGIAAFVPQAQALPVGPEVSAFWPKIGTFTSLRYNYEADANNRPQGHTLTLTIAKRF